MRRHERTHSASDIGGASGRRYLVRSRSGMRSFIHCSSPAWATAASGCVLWEVPLGPTSPHCRRRVIAVPQLIHRLAPRLRSRRCGQSSPSSRPRARARGRACGAVLEEAEEFRDDSRPQVRSGAQRSVAEARGSRSRAEVKPEPLGVEVQDVRERAHLVARLRDALSARKFSMRSWRRS